MRVALLACLTLALVAADKPLTKKAQAEKFHPLIPTPGPENREAAAVQRKQMAAASTLKAIPFRTVGPLGQGGRVVSFAADDRSPAAWVVAFATGGLWCTKNEGADWSSLFDHEAAFALGAVAVQWGEPGVPKTIWAGTGEANASRSSYGGAGLFKSTDGGQTWVCVGLKNSHRIARILVDPKNPDVVFVAAQGALYTEGGERGVYRTTDGGKHWAQVLAAPPRTGAADLAMDPDNSSIVYATLWEKDRKPNDFMESGPGSGIYKSVDGGATWARLQGGFPKGEGVGRIGLAISPQHPPKLYALVDNQSPRPDSEKDPFEDTSKLTAKQIEKLGKEEILKLDDKKLKDFLKDNGFHKDITPESLKGDLKAGKVTVQDVLAYISDDEKALFDVHIIGAELYASEDGGASWKRTHEGRLDELVYSYGYYFGQVRVDPKDNRHVYLLGMPLIESRDGGRTFHGAAGTPEYAAHADFHTLWMDPANPERVVLGHDGGLDISTNGGRSWRGIKNLPVGQFYTIATDNAEPYKIYGGLQDNNVRVGPSEPLRPGAQSDGWRSLLGGDGGFVQVDPRDNLTVYAAYQFGSMYRINAKAAEFKSIQPRHQFKETPYRFNWMTPILLSSHSADILYTGTQRVLRSLDKGATWKEISGDLTTAPKSGNVPFGTITALAESPLRFGLLYAGTDEGRAWASRDGGFIWTDISKGLPAGRWITRLEPSHFDEGTVYATLSAYRSDESLAALFKSVDFGATWTSIGRGLPNENFNVIREDPANKNLLFAGSDMGLYTSLDGGASWQSLGEALPNVAIHDLAIQAKAHDLVVGTHGRSAWVAPIEALEKFTPEVAKEPIHFFEPKKVQAQRFWKRDKPTWWPRAEVKGQAFWFSAATAGTVELRLLNEKKEPVRTWKVNATAGLNRVDWDLLVDASTFKGLPAGRRPFVLPGTYTLKLSSGAESREASMKVEAPKEPDPAKEEEEDEREAI